MPGVAELFEARSPMDAGMLAEVTGTVASGKETKGNQHLQITDMVSHKHEFLITKDKQVLVHDGQVVNKGELIVDGRADPQDILRLLGLEALARYIVWVAEERNALLQAERAALAGADEVSDAPEIVQHQHDAGEI